MQFSNIQVIFFIFDLLICFIPSLNCTSKSKSILVVPSSLAIHLSHRHYFSLVRLSVAWILSVNLQNLGPRSHIKYSKVPVCQNSVPLNIIFTSKRSFRNIKICQKQKFQEICAEVKIISFHKQSWKKHCRQILKIKQNRYFLQCRFNWRYPFNSKHFRVFLQLSLFHKTLSLNSFSNTWDYWYTRSMMMIVYKHGRNIWEKL